MSHVVFCTCAVWAGSVEISVAPALKESRSSTFPADTRRRTCPATCPGTPAPYGKRSTPIFSTSRGLRECFYYNLFNLKTKKKLTTLAGNVNKHLNTLDGKGMTAWTIAVPPHFY